MNMTTAGHVTRSADPLLLQDRDTDAPAASGQSGVSWPAILAGAAAAAALSLILLILGIGLGVSSVSPWAGEGFSASSFGVSTIAWILFMSLAASGIGGYIAGRLRTKWVSVHSDEAYFRDTAHGLLAWAVATVLTASVLSTAVGTILGDAAKATGTVAGGGASASILGVVAERGQSAPSGENVALRYFTDSLFRSSPPANPVRPMATGSPAAPAAGDNAPVTGEVARILARAIEKGSLSPADVHYLGQVIAQHTGLSQDDAEKRVNDTYAELQAEILDAKTKVDDSANKARKASAYAALWIFVSLLLGAFSASLLATFGGRQRELSH